MTGSGKTTLALACVREAKAPSALVLVPTVALLDQWWEHASTFFQLGLDEINIVSGRGRIREGTINIAVLNTAAKIAPRLSSMRPCLLIVDECHRVASEEFRAALTIPHDASLGLSATPERPYDDWLEEVVVPSLGPVICRYDYREAARDGVIVPFHLQNIVFELERDVQEKYDRLTRAIRNSAQSSGLEAPETVRLLLARARVMNLSMNRVRLALRLVSQHRGSQIIVFHEDIAACDLIYDILRQNKVAAGIYHSKIPLRDRADTLSRFRSADISTLVSCRALDEGFDVPQAQVGIIAASTATRRQRIQRLGRVLRPHANKAAATVYTLVATSPEIARLKDEEAELRDVAEISWSRA